VDDALLLVEVADARGDLHDDVARERLGEVGELDDLVEKLAAAPARSARPPTTDAHELEDEEVVIAALSEVEELDDALVPKIAHDLDLFEDVGAL